MYPITAGLIVESKELWEELEGSSGPAAYPSGF